MRLADCSNVLTPLLTCPARNDEGLAVANPLTPVFVGAGEESRTPDLRITKRCQTNVEFC